MNRYPETPRTNSRWYERIAWYCCNVDLSHIERSPNADRISYQGLGWSIIASATTASLSAISGLMLITDSPILSCGGVFIGVLMIWLARWTLSRNGIGDGTSSITPRELLTVGPQILLLLLLGNTLSLPMEYMVLKSEIDVALYTQKSQQESRVKAEVHQEFAPSQQTILRKITQLEADISTQEHRHDQLIFELSSMKSNVESTPSHLRTRNTKNGPSWYDQVEIVERLQSQLSISESQTQHVVKSKRKHIQVEEQQLQLIAENIRIEETQRISNLQQPRGFLDSLNVLQQVGGRVRIFLKGLICSIVLSPFIFMLMLSKNTYWIFKIQPASNEPTVKGDFL